MQQTDPVLRDDLHQSAGGRTIVVEFNLSFNLDLGALCVGTHAVAQHSIQVGFAIEHIRHAPLKAVPLGKIQLQRAEAVGEVEGVYDNACGIGEGVRLNDVHSPSSERSRD